MMTTLCPCMRCRKHKHHSYLGIVSQRDLHRTIISPVTAYKLIIIGPSNQGFQKATWTASRLWANTIERNLNVGKVACVDSTKQSQIAHHSSFKTQSFVACDNRGATEWTPFLSSTSPCHILSISFRPVLLENIYSLSGINLSVITRVYLDDILKLSLWYEIPPREIIQTRPKISV